MTSIAWWSLHQQQRLNRECHCYSLMKGMACSEDRHWIPSSTPISWIMDTTRLNSTKESISTRVSPYKLNSFVEYHYYVLSTDFAVDIPHQRSNKSIAFGVEKRANIMRYQIVHFRKSYQSVSFCNCLYP